MRPARSAALDTLRAYRWPGDIRELRNFVGLTVLMSPGNPIGLEDLPAEFHGARGSPAGAATDLADLRTVEEAATEAAVRACGGNFTKAAKRLGITRSTLSMRAATFALSKRNRGAQ